MSFLGRLREWFEISEGEHRCPHCEGLLHFDLPHQCRGLSKSSVRELIREELKQAEALRDAAKQFHDTYCPCCPDPICELGKALGSAQPQPTERS